MKIENLNKNKLVISLAHLLRYSVSDITDQPEVHLSEGHVPGMARFDMVIQMIKATEKRTDKRHGCDANIIWTQFNQITTNYGQEILYHARALNFSKSGLYFESKYPIKPGITLLFRIEVSRCKASNSEDCECLRTISLADVKWCRDLVKNGESYFGIGARYPIHY